MLNIAQGIEMTQIFKRSPNEVKFVVNTKLAGLVPMAVPAEQAALTEDIRLNSQKEPIILWRGEVIDGRCRLLALETIGWPVEYKELDSELTEEEVAVFVKSINTRRSLTITQKAISAARAKHDKIDIRTIPVIARSWAISEGIMKNAMYIMKANIKMGMELFNGRTVDIVDKKGNDIASSKITAVYAHIKRLEESVPKVPTEYGYNVNALIKTQAGKDWFYEQLKIRKQNSLPNDTNLCMHIGNLANQMFKLPQ